MHKKTVLIGVLCVVAVVAVVFLWALFRQRTTVDRFLQTFYDVPDHSRYEQMLTLTDSAAKQHDQVGVFSTEIPELSTPFQDLFTEVALKEFIRGPLFYKMDRIGYENDCTVDLIQIQTTRTRHNENLSYQYICQVTYELGGSDVREKFTHHWYIGTSLIDGTEKIASLRLAES